MQQRSIACMLAVTSRCSIPGVVASSFELGVVGAPRRFVWNLSRTSFPVLRSNISPCSFPLVQLSSGRATNRRDLHSFTAMSDSETVHERGHGRPGLEPEHHSSERWRTDARRCPADHFFRQLPVTSAGCLRSPSNDFTSIHLSCWVGGPCLAWRWPPDPDRATAASCSRWTLLHLAPVPDDRDWPKRKPSSKLRLVQS